MYTKSEKLDRQLFGILGVPLDSHKHYSLDDLTKRILTSRPPKLRSIENLIKQRREFLEWMALLFRERVMFRDDNQALVEHCTCNRQPDYFEAFHRRNLALHSQLKTKYIQKLEAHLQICLAQLHQALLKNSFLEQRALQMEAEVESMVQQHRQNILRLSQSFAAHTMMTSAQQRFQSLRSFPHQMPPPHPMFQMPPKQFPPASNSMAKLPELNIQMSQGSLHSNLLQTSDTMGSMYSGFPNINSLAAAYHMPPPPGVQLGFPNLAAMQQSGSLGQMQSSGNRSESSLSESIGGQKKTTLNEIDQLKQLITNMTPREELQVPQSEWASPVTSESSDVKKKPSIQKQTKEQQRQGREKTKERSLSHQVEARKVPATDKGKAKRDKTPPISSKYPKRTQQGRKDTSKSPIRSQQVAGGSKRKNQEMKQTNAHTSRVPPRPEQLPLQRSKTPVNRSNAQLGPFSNRHSNQGEGFSPKGIRNQQMRALPKTPEPYERRILTQENHDPFPFESVVSPKFSQSPDISSKVRLATEVPVSGEMSFSGSDGSENKGDFLHNLPSRQSAERLSRNLSTPKSKLYYKTDTVTTPTSSSPYDEKNNTPMGLYKGNVKNLPNYLKPTRSFKNQSASMLQEDRTPKRAANKNVHGRMPSSNNPRASRNQKLRTSTSTLTKKEIETHLMNKSPKYNSKAQQAPVSFASIQQTSQKPQSKQLESKKELRHKLEGIRSSRKNPTSSRASEAAVYSESSCGVRSESENDEDVMVHSEAARPSAELVKTPDEGLSIIKEDLSQARFLGMSEQSSMNTSHKSNSSQKQFPSLHSSEQRLKRKLDSQEYSEDEKEQSVPNFGGGGVDKLKRASKDLGTHSNSSLSSQNRKNSLATLEFINRPSGSKSPMLSSRTGKSQGGLSPQNNGGTFDMANLRGDAHVFSGGEQDSFSFDLGQLEEKINSAELGVEWYCNFDTPNRDRREVEEENDQIKKILVNVNKQNYQIEVNSPQSSHHRLKKERSEKVDSQDMRDSGAGERPEILSFLEQQKDQSMDFETREKLALELAKLDMEQTEEKEEEDFNDRQSENEEGAEQHQQVVKFGEEVEVKSFNSSPVGMKAYGDHMQRRDLTLQDPYLLSEPSYKGKSLTLDLDEEELKMQFRTYSPMQVKTLKRSVTPTEKETSKIPGLRQMPLKLTPRGSVPSLFDTKRQASPITRNQFGFKGE